MVARGRVDGRVLAASCGFAIALLAADLATFGGLPWGSTFAVGFHASLLIKVVPEALSLAVFLVVTAGVIAARPRCTAVLHGLACCAVVATALTSLLSQTAFPMVLLVIALVLGAACGALLTAWGRLLLALDRPRAASVALGALGIYAALAAVAYLLDARIRVLVLAACVCIAIPLYPYAARGTAKPSVQIKAIAPSLISDVATCVRALRPELICVAASLFMLSFVRTATLLGIDNTVVLSRFDAVAAVAAALLGLVWGAAVRHHSLEAVDVIGAYRVSFPVIATAAVLVPFHNEPLLIAAGTALHAAFLVLLALLPALAANLARSVDAPAPMVFGVLGCAMFLSVAISTLASGFIYRDGVVDVMSLLVCALAIVYTLALAYAATQRRSLKARGTDKPAVKANGAAAPSLHVPYEVADHVAFASVAQTYGLTGREEETLVLVVKGHSLRGVATRMGVSENTARSHMRNLYKKLGVHSRQEVLDLLDGQDRETVH